MSAPSHDELTRVFGSDSRGDTAEERAATSTRRFVRSQAQLSPERSGATGPRMTASWALKQFGYAALHDAVEDGAVVICTSLEEPARTFREQRERLGLEIEQVARASGLSVPEVRRAEQSGTVSPIRRLQTLAQSLGLDDEQLSVRPAAGADFELAVRLRMLRRQGQDTHLSPSLVLRLAEAAWTISRQISLTRLLDNQQNGVNRFQPDTDYSTPIWLRGYDLAERTRERLELGPADPIVSVRGLIDSLGIPLVQAEMGQIFAGATVVNGEDRGIVVNTQGDNQNVWVRRMTLCHELGHLLWDPPARLHRLHVDRYDTLQAAQAGEGDEVEARANAFAIALLAPREAVLDIVRRGDEVAVQVAELMSRYGIGATAAKYHLANVSRAWGVEVDTRHIAPRQLPTPDEIWKTNEDWTADFFPVAGVPIGRRGRFAGLVSSAVVRKLISTDTAASWLRVVPSTLEPQLQNILELTAKDLQ